VGATHHGRHFERGRHSSKGGGKKDKIHKFTINDIKKLKLMVNNLKKGRQKCWQWKMQWKEGKLVEMTLKKVIRNFGGRNVHFFQERVAFRITAPGGTFARYSTGYSTSINS